MPSILGWMRTLRDERRALGWRGLFRKRGWKLVAVIVAYYVVRDVTLYVLIPLGIGAGLWK